MCVAYMYENKLCVKPLTTHLTDCLHFKFYEHCNNVYKIKFNGVKSKLKTASQNIVMNCDIEFTSNDFLMSTLT